MSADARGVGCAGAGIGILVSKDNPKELGFGSRKRIQVSRTGQSSSSRASRDQKGPVKGQQP